MAITERVYEVKVALHLDEGTRGGNETATIVVLEVDDSEKEASIEAAVRKSADTIFRKHLNLKHPVTHRELVRVK